MTVTDAQGCTGTATATLAVHPLPTLILTADLDTVCVDSSVIIQASGAASYSWTGDGLQSFTGDHVTAIPPATGTINYVVIGSSNFGCTATATYHLPVVVCIVGTEETQAMEKISLYPNPNTGKFVLEFPSAVFGSANVLIFNQLGEIIWQSKILVTTGVNRVSIDLLRVPAGIYDLKLSTAKGSRTEKLEVIR
ncbi:MAG: T9SS type A sorting domain-containing protein [Saprospiraceae bacterium]